MAKEIHRCVLCDRVDTLELVNRDEGYYKGWYRKDKRTNGYICKECDESVYDILRGYGDN